MVRQTLHSGLKRRRYRAALPAIGLIIALSIASTTQANTEIGYASSVVGSVYSGNQSERIHAKDRVTFEQRIRTDFGAATTLEFHDKTRMSIGESAELILDELVYDPKRSQIGGLVELKQGLLRFASVNTRPLDFSIQTSITTIGIRGTVFDLYATEDSSEIVVHAGKVEVISQFGNRLVSPGQVYRVDAASGGDFQSSPSPELSGAVKKLVARIGAKETGGPKRIQVRATPVPRTLPTDLQNLRGHNIEKVAGWRDGRVNPSINRVSPSQAIPQIKPRPIAKSRRIAALSTKPQPPAFHRAIAGKDAENLLFLDLKYGRIVIEMRPDLAPNHVKRIKQLTRSGFYDGLTFHRVKRLFAAETGDPTGTGKGGSGQRLKAEISFGDFSRGAVGMKHELEDLDSADSQFFIITASAPHLNRKYTLWGRVIYGIDFVDLLQPGAPPRHPDRIYQAHIASDLEALK